jgi:hypothetical protein
MTEVTAEYVREHLSYNPETGEFFWRIPMERGVARRVMGVPVGSRRKDGYVRIGFGVQIYVGTFQTKEDAANAYLERAKMHNGEFARL